MAVAEDDWTVVPGKGLGRLVFGMSPAQVDAMSDAYGVVAGRRDGRVPDDVLRDTLEKFGTGMSDEEKQALMAVHATSGPPADCVIETRSESGIVLGYRSGRLMEIMSADDQHPLFLDGKDVLSLDGLEALALLERLNGGPGRYCGTEGAFDALAISVDGFSVTDRDTGVQPLEGADARFRARTVTLRPEPYRPGAETDRLIVQSVSGNLT
ncbi:hypothetical protein IU469_32255 [Nocardia puris]|uniref:Uncharacterized protein n=1 Tax=Nocardia puris TaxID=208602 RepID=A0A366CSJ0_9NOCA|nr:hypothetical protein [Nocardia puris]MBF6216247.1 hypothetical protein [Nocardia puris]MBF6370341.1 hypothetical protein [Nocardia puris]RBO78321.1 hypothetical protein DFR74_1512 [Nocardia puris]